jgi:hypothetical protein
MRQILITGALMYGVILPGVGRAEPPSQKSDQKIEVIAPQPVMAASKSGNPAPAAPASPIASTTPEKASTPAPVRHRAHARHAAAPAPRAPETDVGTLRSGSALRISAPGSVSSGEPSPERPLKVAAKREEPADETPSDKVSTEEMRNRTRAMQSCYDNAVKKDPALQSGRITLNIRFAADGAVTDARVESDTLAVPAVTECVRTRAFSFRPSLATNARAESRYVFVFHNPNAGDDAFVE